MELSNCTNLSFNSFQNISTQSINISTTGQTKVESTNKDIINFKRMISAPQSVNQI